MLITKIGPVWVPLDELWAILHLPQPYGERYLPPQPADLGPTGCHGVDCCDRDRHAAGDPGGAEAEYHSGLSGDGRGDLRRIGTGDRPGADTGLDFRGIPEMAAAHRLGSQTALRPGFPSSQTRLGFLPVCGHAVHRSRAGHLGDHRPPDARQPAADRPRGLYPHRAGQRPAGARW